MEKVKRKERTKGDESVFTKKTFTYGCVLEKDRSKTSVETEEAYNIF